MQLIANSVARFPISFLLRIFFCIIRLSCNLSMITVRVSYSLELFSETYSD